jgi:hypothetical protein
VVKPVVDAIRGYNRVAVLVRGMGTGKGGIGASKVCVAVLRV